MGSEKEKLFSICILERDLREEQIFVRDFIDFSQRS